MQRFNLYVVWEISKLFLVALVAFTTVIMLAGVVQQLISQGLGPSAVIQLLPYVLPISLQFALPATILFAVASVYGRISADNEVLALMSSGVKPIRIITPSLIACFLLSLFAVWINDIAISWGRPGINRVIMHSIEQVVYGFLSTQGNYTSGSGLSIHVHGLGDDGELISPTLTMIQDGSDTPISISARTGRLTMDAEKDVLRIELTDSSGQLGSTETIYPGKYVQEIELSDATKKGTTSGHPSEVPIRRIGFEKQKESLKIESTRKLIASRTAMGLGLGRYDWLDSEETHDNLAQIESAKGRVRRLNIEPWRRWAQGFSCFCFVWVAIPFSIWLRSADHWTSFGACFMPILLLYYPLFAIGLGNAKDGVWPPFTVWLGNLVLIGVGLFWLRKIHRN